MDDGSPRYPYYRYDFRGTLRLRLFDWLWLGFLGRHVLFTVVLAAAQGRGTGGAIGAGFAFLIEPWFMIADIPAVCLLIAAANRVPKAGDAVRFLWRNGAYVVLLSALLYGGIFAWLAASGETVVDGVAWVSLGATCALGLYAFFGRYPRDVFASFPPRDAS